MTNYYNELASHPDDARVVGWESRLAQLVRFEAVRTLIQPNETVLDLGAGLGDFARYLTQSRLGCHYSGIEARQEFVARALQKSPPVMLKCSDAFADTATEEADVVAVVGALVDGRPLTDRTSRFTRLRQMIQASVRRARRLAVFVIARQDRLETHPTLALDPALGGIELTEIPWILDPAANYAVISDLLPNDYLLVVAAPPHPLPPIPTGAAIRATALAHPGARELPPDARVRFHLAIGEAQMAAQLLEEVEASPTFSPDAAWHLLKARLALSLDS